MIHVKDTGSWKRVSAMYVKDSGVWKEVRDTFHKEDGGWVLGFEGRNGWKVKPAVIGGVLDAVGFYTYEGDQIYPPLAGDESVPYGPEPDATYLMGTSGNGKIPIYTVSSISDAQLTGAVKIGRRLSMVFPADLSESDINWLESFVPRVRIRDLTTNEITLIPLDYLYYGFQQPVYWLGTRDYTFNTSRTYLIQPEVTA